MSEIDWYIDPVAATLLGILALGVVVVMSFDFLRVRVVERDRTHCECGSPLIVERYCPVCDRDRDRR